MSNPAEPESIGNAQDARDSAGLAIVGKPPARDHARRLEVLDISDAEDPTSVASVVIPSENFAGSITVANGRAYLERSGDGVHVIDVSSPATPVRLGVLPISGPQETTAVAGR